MPDPVGLDVGNWPLATKGNAFLSSCPRHDLHASGYARDIGERVEERFSLCMQKALTRGDGAL